MTEETPLREELRAAFHAPAPMSEGEILTRAREAWIASHKPGRWLARRIRLGFCDKRLRAIVTALRDVPRPMSLIVADRDEATCALIMRTTPGIDAMGDDDRRNVAAAIMTAVRMGRRG
jgi:hypothetical protein